MHNVEARRVVASSKCIKSFNARLAVDYPAYSMVNWPLPSYRQVKTCIALCSAILTEWVKMTVIFVSYGSLAQHSARFKSDIEMK